MCTAPDTRDKFLREVITLRFFYHGKHDKPIADFDVAESDCPSQDAG